MAEIKPTAIIRDSLEREGLMNGKLNEMLVEIDNKISELLQTIDALRKGGGNSNVKS